MNQHFKSNERELVRIVSFFKKQSKKLIEEGKLGEEHGKVGEAVDSFIVHLEQHVNTRVFLKEQHDHLQQLVKDNAACPKCAKKDLIKHTGTEKNDKGWKSNRYKCRRCNIAFTWNLPNNPWDMIAYIDEMLVEFQKKLEDVNLGAAERADLQTGIENATANLSKIKPVIEAHDKEFNTFQEHETEMEKLVHEFKNTLLIEKIKMDTWENRNA